MQGQITAATYIDVDLVYDGMSMITYDPRLSSGDVAYMIQILPPL